MFNCTLRWRFFYIGIVDKHLMPAGRHPALFWGKIVIICCPTKLLTTCRELSEKKLVFAQNNAVILPS
jgi:hypothetical protein